MRNRRISLDRIAGRVYTRVLSVLTAFVSAGMLVAAVIAWATRGPGVAWIWVLGAVVFGVVARVSWRSRAALSDIDFTS